MAQLVKKATIKQAHNDAIAAYRAWLDQHPSATPEEKAREFDIMVDTAELDLMLNDDS
jgi:hypothetical protein